jgi:hypothetical protein
VQLGTARKPAVGPLRLAPALELGRHLVPPGGVAGPAGDRLHGVEAEGEQHGLLEPLVHGPRRRRRRARRRGPRLAQGIVGSSRKGPDQRKARHRLNEDRRGGGDKQNDQPGEQRNDHVGPAGHQCCPVSAARIGVRFLARHHGGGQRGQVDRMAAKGGGQGAEETTCGEDRAGLGLVAIGMKHRDARDVLSGHGDDEQWHR